MLHESPCPATAASPTDHAHAVKLITRTKAVSTSVIGVSRTRSAPYFCKSPLVICTKVFQLRYRDGERAQCDCLEMQAACNAWAVCQSASSREISKQSCSTLYAPWYSPTCTGTFTSQKSCTVQIHCDCQSLLWKQIPLQRELRGPAGLRTSSPRTKTSGSRDISSSIAELSASRMVISCKPSATVQIASLHSTQHARRAQGSG